MLAPDTEPTQYKTHLPETHELHKPCYNGAGKKCSDMAERYIGRLICHDLVALSCWHTADRKVLQFASSILSMTYKICFAIGKSRPCVML